MIWIVLALLVALVAVVLGLCALVAWREPVRRGGQVIDFTGARPKYEAPSREGEDWAGGRHYE